MAINNRRQASASAWRKASGGARITLAIESAVAALVAAGGAARNRSAACWQRGIEAAVSWRGGALAYLRRKLSAKLPDRSKNAQLRLVKQKHGARFAA